MSFFDKMSLPGAKMSNSLVPKPRGGVIGPPKMKMPEVAGDPQLRAGRGMMRSSLGPKLKSLPTHPFQPTNADASLLHSKSPRSGLMGINKQ